MPHFGAKVTGDRAYLDAVKNEAGGGEVFGTRVRDAIPDTPAHREKRASEFGPRTLMNEDGSVGSNAPQEPSIDDIRNILAENPTYLDSLYELELARADGARPEALRIFQQVESGIKGQGRQDILDEIQGLLTSKVGQGERTAGMMEATAEQTRRMLARSEENAALRDAPRLKALKDRKEALDAVQAAKEQQQESAPALTANGQVAEIARERGLDIGTTGSRSPSPSDTPTKPDGPVHAETQQPGTRPIVPKAGQEGEGQDFREVTTAPETSATEPTSSPTQTPAQPRDYEGETKDALEEEVARREIDPTTIKGTGANGAVLKADLVKALQKHDRTAGR
jgi:hypothetical protein